MRVVLLAMAMMAATGMLLTGCEKNSAGAEKNEAAQSQEEFQEQSVSAGGWEITVEDAIAEASLENVSVELGYTGVNTNDFVQEAQEGNEYCLIKLKAVKGDSTEDIKWESMALTDGQGNEYHRIKDDFLTELDMMRMSGSDLNFGENEGWIAFEIKEGAEGLVLSYPFESESFEVEIVPAGKMAKQSAASGEEDENLITNTGTFAAQDAVDASLKKESEQGYSFQEPKVIMNPYGNSPLTAVAVFSTKESIGGTVTVKGKDAKDDISGTFPAAKNHIVPIYGLYNGESTQVELALEDGTSTTLELTTEKQELALGEISAEMIDDSAYDYSQLTFACSTGGPIYAMDSKGDIRWCFQDGGTLGVHQLSNGRLMVPSTHTLKPMYYKSGLKEIDLSGKVYREYAIPGGMHHDFYEMESGNILVASDSQDLSTVEDYIVEINPKTGAVEWELNMADILDTTDGASASHYTDGGEEIDWFHNNGVWYDEANDLILLSARHVDAIVAVHREEKSLAWILGNPDGWTTVDEKYFFTPVGDDFEWQYAQHQVSMLDNGDIMLFDNGTAKVKGKDNDNRVTGDDIYSRAVIYRINTEDMTVQQVFQYGKERGPQWYSDWISGAVSLDGTQNNLWITAGSNLYSEEEDRHDYYPSNMFTPGLIKTTHMDHVVNGELAYEITVSGDGAGSLTYRSFRMGMYENGLTLNAATAGVMMGDLGETKPVEEEISLGDALELDEAGWIYNLDDSKFTVAGAYSTNTKAEELKASYLVLKSETATKAYALGQTGTDGEENTTVNVTGWTSVNGLEGDTYDICLVLDGQAYITGKKVLIEHSNINYMSDGTKYYGYYDQAVKVESDLWNTVPVSADDASAKAYETEIAKEETLVGTTAKIDAQIQETLESGEYTWENPMVITNPYHNSPLTAMVLFQTEEECAVRVTVKGKKAAQDISGEIETAANHRVPVVGLYPDTENKVVVELLDESGKATDSQEFTIKTEPLGEFFDDQINTEQTSGESAFGLLIISGQSSRYPYAIDAAGDIRWCLDRRSGNYGIFALSNNRFMFHDDVGYTITSRKSEPTDMYEMDYLGRAYQLYYVQSGIHHDIIEKEPGGNLLVLSNSVADHVEDVILELDRKTGEVVKSLNIVESFDESLRTRVDWAHLNTVSYNPEDNSLLLSPRNINSAIKINWDTAELMWILSDPAIWEGTPYEKYVLKPIREFHWQYQQHSVYEVGADLDNNPDTLEISMFDNHWDGFAEVETFDNLTESFSKIFSINEKEMTVDLLKEYPCELSYITSNTIVDVDSGHVFSMSSQTRDRSGRRGYVYELDYETGDVINKFSTKDVFYRGMEMLIDWNDLAKPLKTEDAYMTGTLRALMEADDEVETPKKVIDPENVEMKMMGDVLQLKANAHYVSQVIFKGKDHSYVYDLTPIIQYKDNYLKYESNMVMPLSQLEKDEYQVLVVYKNVFYDTGETITKK